MTEECPKCECNDIRIVRNMNIFGFRMPEWGCNWCGYTWTEQLDWDEIVKRQKAEAAEEKRKSEAARTTDEEVKPL